MIAVKKLFLINQRKRTLSPDDYKNYTADFSLLFMWIKELLLVGLVDAFCLVSIPSCRYLKLLTRTGWYLGNYPPRANMNFSD